MRSGRKSIGGDSVRNTGDYGRDKLQMTLNKYLNRYLAFLEYLWVIFVVLNGNSVYHAMSTGRFPLLEIAVGMTFLLLVTEFILRKIHPTRTNVIIAMFLLLYGTFYLGVMQTKMNAGEYIKLIVVGGPLAFMLFAELNRQKLLLKLLHRFVDVLCVMAVISLVFWYLGVVIEAIEPNTPLIINWGNFNRIEGFYGLHFAFQTDTTFFPDAYIYRNSGIFAEAPMFNLWLNIALSIELFLTEKPAKWRIVLLGITILTTMSVTGIIFMAICTVLMVLLRFKTMKRTQKGIILICTIVGIPALLVLLANIIVLKGDTQSFQMRLSDYIGGVKLWMEYPVFGAGFGSLSALQPYIYSPEGSVGFSNSVMAVLGTGGMWTALLYYLPHVCMAIPRLTGSKRIACFGGCMLFLFCTTIFFARYIGILIVMLGLAFITGPKYEDI